MNYTELQTEMQQLLVLADPYGQVMFNALLPAIIADAEGRIYRDTALDFLWQRTVDVTQITTPGFRDVPIPSQFTILEGVSLITPAGLLPSQKGARRIPLLLLTRQVLDLTWPNESLIQAPTPFETYFAVYSEQESVGDGEESDEAIAVPSSVKIAPTPDAAYHTEFTGLFNPPPMSATNPTTRLATLYPELFLAAAMVFGCALLKNWSAMADDPRSAISWEAHYNMLKMVAAAESDRIKSQSDAMTASGPALSPPRPMMPPPTG